MTASELAATGVRKMRLPAWHAAYLVPNETGPWAKLYDVNYGIGGGQPLDVLLIECDQDDRWLPA